MECGGDTEYLLVPFIGQAEKAVPQQAREFSNPHAFVTWAMPTSEPTITSEYSADLLPGVRNSSHLDLEMRPQMHSG